MGISENSLSILAPELKIIRDLSIGDNFEISNNLYVIGAATGLFRGILQSLCSGLRCGQLIKKEMNHDVYLGCTLWKN